MRLVELLYRLTQRFPVDEKSGLTATIRRTVTTMSTRIADAFECSVQDPLNDADKLLRELIAYLLICRRLRYISSRQFSSLRRRCERLMKLLSQSGVRLQDKDGEEDRLRKAA